MKKIIKILPVIGLFLLGIAHILNTKRISDYANYTLEYIKIHQEMTDAQNEEILYLSKELLDTRKELFELRKQLNSK